VGAGADAAVRRSRHDGTDTGAGSSSTGAAGALANVDPGARCAVKAASLAEKLLNTSSTVPAPDDAGDENEGDLINDGNSGAAAGTYGVGANVEGAGAGGAAVRKSGNGATGAGVGTDAAANRSRHDGTSAEGEGAEGIGAEAAANRSRHDGTSGAGLAGAAGTPPPRGVPAALWSVKAANLAEKLLNTSSTPPAGAGDETGGENEDDLINEGNSGEEYGVAAEAVPGSDKAAKVEANVANASSTGRGEPDGPAEIGAPIPYVLSVGPGTPVAICQRLFLTTRLPKPT